MKFVCASDIHGSSLALAAISGTARECKADAILLAGDIVVHHIYNGFMKLLYDAAEHARCSIILTLGNHDRLNPAKYFPDSAAYIDGTKPITRKSVVCLIEQQVEFQGLKIWGSPFTTRFQDWAWMRDVADVKFDIPKDADILLTHECVFGKGDSNSDCSRMGCEVLAKAVEMTPNVRLHIFGHCHASGGYEGMIGNTLLLNVACHDEEMNFVHEGIRVVDI